VSHAKEGLPLVSIIINNYNYGHFLSEAIDSSLKQTYSCIEVIVVDDGSTDNSREVISSYEDQIIPVLKENGGQSSAFNVGFAVSRGDIIFMLDSDDVFFPEKVAQVVNIFEQYQDIGWCFHRLRFIDANTDKLIKLSHESGSRKCDFRGHLKKGELPFNSPATSGLCFTRSLLQQILPMPEASGVNVSDHYLKVTALALSKGFFLDEQLACLRIHNNNIYTLKGDKEQLKARILILTAYWLQYDWPFLTKFGNKLLAKGISIYWKCGDVEAEYVEKIKSYLSAVSSKDKIEIGLRVIYYRFKF
jgi:glycosyltransferase involved in cell wall biosynthesis